VVLVAAADEELGSRLGMEYLLAEGIVTGDWAIIPDAGSKHKTVFIAEKAAFFSTITSYGKQAHGSRPHEGVNAIKNLMEVLRRIDGMPFDVTQHKLLTPPTYNLGMIQGGIAPNVVPAKCTADIDIRFLPGDSSEAIRKKIEKICRDVEKEIPGARFEWAPRMVDTPIELAEDHPLVSAVIEETRSALGITVRPAGLSGSTVAKFCMKRGIPAVNFAPSDGTCAHMANEFADVDTLASFAYVLTRIVQRLLK
jgi:acetylornithine deacetylase/succinyl-diaminopimelate desuccinylase-like protein